MLFFIRAMRMVLFNFDRRSLFCCWSRRRVLFFTGTSAVLRLEHGNAVFMLSMRITFFRRTKVQFFSWDI